MAKKKGITEAAPAAKTATLEIDGKAYSLKYDFNSLCEVEPSTGCNLLRGLNDLANLSVGQLRGLLLAGIRAADPASTMTLPDAGNMIRIDTIGLITEAIAESIVLTLPPGTVDKTKDGAGVAA